MIRIKSSSVLKEMSNGIDTRITSVLVLLNEKIRDVSILEIRQKDRISIDASLYKKPLEIVDLINRSHPCAEFMEHNKSIHLRVGD